MFYEMEVLKVSKNFYEQFYETQKAMLNTWENWIKQSTAVDNENFNPMKLFDEYKKASEEMSSTFMKSFEDSKSAWEKASESLNYYQSMYQLWNKLSDAVANQDAKTVSEVYSEWLADYNGYLKSSLLPYLPDQAKEMTAKFMDTSESYSKAMESFWKPWNENFGNMSEVFSEAVFSDPKAYLSFLDMWKENYDKTIGKFMKAPAFGLEKEFLDLQKSSMDRYIKYSIAMNELVTSFFQIGQDATKKVMDDYVKMYADGTQPKTFEEFYKYWADNINSAYQKVLLSNDFSKLVGHMVEAMSEFKKVYDKLFELWLSNVPVPKKSEMDSLYKTVYDLKKELRTLKAEVTKMKPAAVQSAKTAETADNSKSNSKPVINS